MKSEWLRGAQSNPESDEHLLPEALATAVELDRDGATFITERIAAKVEEDLHEALDGGITARALLGLWERLLPYVVALNDLMLDRRVCDLPLVRAVAQETLADCRSLLGNEIVVQRRMELGEVARWKAADTESRQQALARQRRDVEEILSRTLLVTRILERLEDHELRVEADAGDMHAKELLILKQLWNQEDRELATEP